MDLQRIDPSIPGEIERWATQLAVSPQALTAAIREIGTDIDKLRGYLAGHHDGHHAPAKAPGG